VRPVGAPEVPPGTLIQSLLIDDDGEAAGYRISRDGRYRSRTKGSPWTEGPRLTPERVAEVERAIADSGFDDLEDRYEQPAVDDAPSTLWFQVARPGGVRTVEVVGDRPVPALQRLTARLLEILGPG